MRALFWLIGAALSTASLLYADGADNDRNHGPGGQVPGQAAPQAQQRFPTVGATGNASPPKSARRPAPRRKAAPKAAPGPAAAGSTRPAPLPRDNSANAASHIQKRPQPQAGRVQTGPTSNIPGMGVAKPGPRNLGAERQAGRQKMASLGVRHAPRPIRDQAHVVRSGPEQSRVNPPSHGPDNRGLAQRPLDLRHFGGSGMGARMQGLSTRPRMQAFSRLDAQEREPGRYYWHDDGGQRYCHYLDPWGFQWYGWYSQDEVLWVRFYGDRWWSYDADTSRWLFWSDGQWWWQDDDEGGALYVYSDGTYFLN